MSTDNQNAPLLLIVEDDPNHIRLIQLSFADGSKQYRLVVAQSLSEAKSALESQFPDLILTDSRLSDGYGGDLVGMVDNQCPVIIMTSHGNEQIAEEAMKIGAYDLLEKSPETFTALPCIVAFTLKNWSFDTGAPACRSKSASRKERWANQLTLFVADMFSNGSCCK